MKIINITQDTDREIKTVYYEDSKINKVIHKYNGKRDLPQCIYLLCSSYLKENNID